MSWSTSTSNRMKRIFGADIPIIEATKTVRLSVRPAHLRGAKAGSAVCCGIAKALGGSDVAVMRTTTYVRELHKGKPVVVKYKNGDDAQAFIKMFDTGGLTLSRPMSITLLPVPPSHKKVACHKRHKALVARVTAGKPARAYQKPTMAKGSKVKVYRPGNRTVVIEDTHRCAIRWAGLNAL